MLFWSRTGSKTRPNLVNFIVSLFQASTIDPDRKGACPMCHRYFMALYLKYEADDIDLVVTRVKNTKTLPVCLDGQNFQVRMLVDCRNYIQKFYMDISESPL